TPITAWTNLAPGDAITVTISHVSGTNWSIAVDDATQHETFITNQTYTGPAQSADWILEAPQISGLQATLADYTEFPFSKVAASGPDTTDTWVVMVQKGAIVSVPSDVGEGGTSFKMAYGAAVPAPP
ncbi:MAG: G1 family glutamic endopeptidase, partial [Candidatus Dormibacteria bacterium]